MATENLMSDTDPAIQALLYRLHNAGRLRVWSVVVTIFGELVQPRQQQISVQELLALTHAVGIEENALRTALSRLAKEGWVEREKQGRLAFYALSQRGRQTFLAASNRIYRPSFESQSTQWYLGNFKDAIKESDNNTATGFSLGKHWLLMNEAETLTLHSEDVVIFKTDPISLPEWMIDQLIPETLEDHYDDLLTDLKTLSQEPDAIQSMSPITALVTRVLVIHAWRRLVLRHPLLPRNLLSPQWPGFQCHSIIRNIYPQLVARSEEWWELATSDSGKQMLESRFYSQQTLQI